MCSRFSCQERLDIKFGNSRRETQARKQLENEKYETWFHDEKTRLRGAEVSFLIAKTVMRKRSLRFVGDNGGDVIEFRYFRLGR